MALTNKLTAIANAIRAKTGKSAALSLDDMVTEIGSISGGGSAVVESKTITTNGTYTAPEGVDGYSPVVVNVANDFPTLTFSGDLSHWSCQGQWDSIFEKYGNKINTQDIQNMSYAFQRTHRTLPNLSNITLNFATSSHSILTLSYCFDGAAALVTENSSFPKIGTIDKTKIQTLNMSGLFQNCYSMREIPSDWVDKIPVEKDGYKRSIFSNCKSLREIPQSWLNNLYNSATSSSLGGIYNNLCIHCASLDEVLNINCISASYTSSSIFSGFLTECFRLKNFTFKTDNGTPYKRKWKNMLIDLSTYTGYAPGARESDIIGYKSGITADKKVTDTASYEALKNDPDWYTTNIEYSRYNHDSAVTTINSLPDTSSYGTNTIKFKGAAGSATDGGAINTLTAAEIAVATNKGWTVTLV